MTRAGVAAAATLVATLTLLLAAGAEARPANACPDGQIRTQTGCTPLPEVRRGLASIVDQFAAEHDLKAALLRIDIGNKTLARVTHGESVAGVPANLRMHFRIGSIAIPYLIDILLQLQEAGEISLDDTIDTWFPDLPNADRITLRMLATATSGYPDWIQENPTFINELYANPFRQWTSEELLDIALNRELICDPGACFHYAHTGFILIAKVLKKVTGTSAKTLLERRVLRPLGLRETTISPRPSIPEPVLHAYTADRGPYEDSTYWSPSWGIASTMLMTSTIGDVVKSAKALGKGALVSKASSRERFSPAYTSALPPFSQDTYYGLGVLIDHGWQFQNPQQNGYTVIQGYLPSRRMALALATTKGIEAAQTSTNFSQALWSDITAYLTPDHYVEFQQ